MKRSLITIPVLVVTVLCSGCGMDTAQTEKKILSHDPSFRKSLGKRDELRRKIASRENEFLDKKQKIIDQMNALDARKKTLKKEYVADVSSLKNQIQPERRLLEKELIELRHSYNLKARELSGVARDIREIRDLMEKQDKLPLTQEEIRIWNERLNSLEERRSRLVEEKGAVKREIEMVKLKLRVLKI